MALQDIKDVQESPHIQKQCFVKTNKIGKSIHIRLCAKVRKYMVKRVKPKAPLDFIDQIQVKRVF